MELISIENPELIENSYVKTEVASEGLDLILNFYKNTADNYVYMSVAEKTLGKILSYTRVVPFIDYFSLSPSYAPKGYELRWLNISEISEDLDIDVITPDNINKVFKLWVNKEEE